MTLWDKKFMFSNSMGSVLYQLFFPWRDSSRPHPSPPGSAIGYSPLMCKIWDNPKWDFISENWFDLSWFGTFRKEKYFFSSVLSLLSYQNESKLKFDMYVIHHLSPGEGGGGRAGAQPFFFRWPTIFQKHKYRENFAFLCLSALSGDGDDKVHAPSTEK